MPRRLPHLALLCLLAASPAFAQEETLQPTWETQRQARTFSLSIPAPRGQITDRNGEVLAQTRVSYNLTVVFPTPLEFTDAQVLSFARRQIDEGRALTGREIALSDEVIVRHYHNRGLLPLDIATDLSAKEQESVRAKLGNGLELRPVYRRYYPNASLAAHILGYASREGRPPDGPIQNNDLLWPDTEGREGLELSFNRQLTGRPGQVTYNFDAKGHKVSEKVVTPPLPGYNVVTTLDLSLQRLCEKALAAGVKRGAIVVMEPQTGDILAMASYPSYDPNLFVPAISTENFRALNENRNHPLIPRAYRAAYPPGSIFKMFVAFAALESGKVGPEEKLSGPPSLQIGDRVFRNWKKTHSGMLDVSEALEESNDTWFYQVGMRTGSRLMVEWATRFGFGARTGIPLRAEESGRIPNDEYMLKIYKRRMLDGDLANFSIGQGDILVTPLQMAQAVSIIANNGAFYQTRLVRQIQSIDDKVVTGYELRLLDELPLSKVNLKAVRRGMIDSVTGGRATGRRASVDDVDVAGKTGTAQWGPKDNQRYAAWFVGFAPAQEPRYALAVIYESDPNENAGGGASAAPIAGKVFNELFRDEAPPRRKKRKAKATPTPAPDAPADEPVDE